MTAPGAGWGESARSDPGAAILARAAGRGDAGALARLVPVLYRIAGVYLRRRLRGVDPEDVADLASEGVVKIVERLHTARADSDAAFFGWAHAVVWRAALDAQRSRGRRDAGWRAAPLADAPPGHFGQPGRRAGVVLPPGASLSAVAETDGNGSPTQVLARLAAEAQDQLAPEAVSALWAHLVLGAAWTEVAAVLGTTPGAAKRRFQRALVVLRAAVWARAAALPPNERQAVLTRLRALDPAHGYDMSASPDDAAATE